MLQQLNAKIGDSVQLSKFLEAWISRKPKLAESVDAVGMNIINAVLILEGIWNTIPRQIVLAGTSRSVYHGTTQCYTAGKMVTTVILEITGKRENILGSIEGPHFLSGPILNAQYNIRMIGKSVSGLTDVALVGNPLGSILRVVGEEASVFLELKCPDQEWPTLSV